MEATCIVVQETFTAFLCTTPKKASAPLRPRLPKPVATSSNERTKAGKDPAREVRGSRPPAQDGRLRRAFRPDREEDREDLAAEGPQAGPKQE